MKGTRRSASGLVLAILLVASLGALSCVVHRTVRSNVLEFLYPEGSTPYPATAVDLQVPLRVGIAFAPRGGSPGEWEPPHPIPEEKRLELLQRIGDAFEGRESIQSIQSIPSSYLTPGGGFANLDRLKAAFGIDLIALVSYEQAQFSETTRKSWTYWTLVGAYLVKGEKNETSTVMDLVVYDIPSRAMLLRAAGNSSLGGASTPIDSDRQLRMAAGEGFDKATDSLIANLDTAIDGFEKQAMTGTVHGLGTPEVVVRDATGAVVSSGGAGGGGGAGALGPVEIALIAILVAILLGGLVGGGITAGILASGKGDRRRDARK